MRRAQALVEFALAVPVFIVFVFGVIQLALAFIWFYSQTYVTRDVARWLAINSNTDDAAVATEVRRVLLPGLIGGVPTLVSAGTTTSDTAYRVGNMSVWFTPCLPSGSPATCSHPDRTAGSTLHVTMRYDASNIIFLPTRFHLGWMSLNLPTTLPAYTVYVMTE